MRIRQHANPTRTYYETFRGVRPRFEPGRPIEVEVGCADAQFLFERAAQDPTRHYVGLEIRDELVDWVNKKAAATGAPVVAVFCHAQKHLAEVFAPASIARVYVNFPDPWFKRRHAERRMVDDELVTGLASRLAPGADVFMQTDGWDLALAGSSKTHKATSWPASRRSRARTSGTRTRPGRGRSGAPATRSACARGASRTPRRPGCRSGGCASRAPPRRDREATAARRPS